MFAQGDQGLVLRVSLPIDAPRKTETEVATMMYIKENTVTSCPSPSIEYPYPSGHTIRRFEP